ncbi:hypothetical protein GQ53DRAFT_354048 [Thozetella sp. PMI_491]|nr:hypothetical protein GQ53DRAFT_354048 [Thozetella sp. PMI_491]
MHSRHRTAHAAPRPSLSSFCSLRPTTFFLLGGGGLLGKRRGDQGWHDCSTGSVASWRAAGSPGACRPTGAPGDTKGRRPDGRSICHSGSGGPTNQSTANLKSLMAPVSTNGPVPNPAREAWWPTTIEALANT